MTNPRLPRLRAFAAALAVALPLASCGKSSKSTAPVVTPSVSLGAAIRLLVPATFAVPANLDTTGSLLVTTSVDDTKAALSAFVSGGGLTSAGNVYLRTINGPPDSLQLTQLAGITNGLSYVVYYSVPYVAEGIKIPFDGNGYHVWNVKGSSTISAFIDSVQSVDDVDLTAPAASANVPRASDLTVSWSDGGVAADVFVGAAVISSADTTRHVAAAAVLSSAGSLIVPTAKLAALPAGAATLAVARYRLAFRSENGHPTSFLVEAVVRRPITLN